MEGYLITILDDASSPKQYWGEDKFQDDVMRARIYTDVKEAISTSAGLQARYNTVEMKVCKCRTTVEIIPGNPFAELRQQVKEDEVKENLNPVSEIKEATVV